MFCGGPLSPESVISWPRMGGNSPSGTVCQEVTSVLKRLRDPLLLLDRLEPAAPADRVGHVAVSVREDRRVGAVLGAHSDHAVPAVFAEVVLRTVLRALTPTKHDH